MIWILDIQRSPFLPYESTHNSKCPISDALWRCSPGVLCTNRTFWINDELNCIEEYTVPQDPWIISKKAKFTFKVAALTV